MLQITIPAREQWDEKKQEFIETEEYVLKLEHSLASLSKWESKWCQPFLSKKGLTEEETLDYIKCMTLNEEDVPDNIYANITSDLVYKISEYIEAPMTATWFSKENGGKKSNNEVVTAELIYYWMIALQIPFDCEHWHLNKLLTLVRICNIKNAPPKKRSKRDILSQNAALNAARRKQLNTKG